MQLKIHLLLSYCTLYCNLYIFPCIQALVGENVRQACEQEFPFVVALGTLSAIFNQTFITFCTGTLVSNRDVLTAEHCMQPQQLNNVKIAISSRDLRSMNVFNPWWWLTYDHWTTQNNMSVEFTMNDIVIVRLTEHVILNQTFQPGVISDLRVRDLFYLDVMMVGWGKKDDNRLPLILRVGDVTVMDMAECRNRVHQAQRRRPSFESNLFCSSARPMLLGHKGDSGGPVIYMRKIVGITKGTTPFPRIDIHPDKVNLHFGIHFYRNYIYDLIQNYE